MQSNQVPTPDLAGLPSLAAAEHLVDDTLTAGAILDGVLDDPPARAKVVVIGAGIMGASVAYHLAKLGVTDCVLLERDRVTSGSTWHPAGLIANVRASHALTELARHSVDVYGRIAAESGIANGFNQRGCLVVARTAERFTEISYSAAIADHHGIEAEVLSAAESAARHPLLDPARIHGGVLFPADGTVNPGASALGLIKVAADLGVRVFEQAAAEAIETRDGRVTAVRTSRGTIECETVVLCTGLWSRQFARTVGVDLALHPADHMWMYTEPVDAAVWELPFVRDLDGHIYVRGYRDRLLVGAFEPHGKPRAAEVIGGDFSFGEFAFDHEHAAPSLERARECMPVLRELQMERHLSAPETFTPDNLPLVGETAEVRGLFVGAGMNSQGILLGPGSGRALAEWIVNDGPTLDVAALAPGRFAQAQSSPQYLFARTRESLGRLYAMHWPFLQSEAGRGLRRTALHHRLTAAGACFGELAGWERANWFGEPGDRPEYDYTYGRPAFFDRVAIEHRAAREAVALFDLSSFSKFEIAGRGALQAVQRVFAGDLDVAVGRVVYTTMLNARGGIEIDLTVARLADDRFLAIAPAATQTRVLHWLRHHADDATVTDVTSGFATLAVMGPESRTLLQRLTDADLTTPAFPFGTAQTIELGWGRALALRVSFVGELGWELYVPTDGAEVLYDAILEAGRDLGLRHAGYHALDTLRMEKGFRHWPHDIGPTDTPIDGGLAFTVAWDKPGFIGREALLGLREEPRRRRIVHLTLDDPDALLHHDESLRLDGRPVGHVTSGAYGHHLGRAVGLACITDPELLGDGAIAGGQFAVDVAGRLVPATLSVKPFYDPSGARMRA